jgi:hypothetical protein
VRHARDADLDRLETALGELRNLPGLTEKKRGTFYRRGRAFLHFHVDGPEDDLYADVRLGGGGDDFTRLPVTTPGDQQQLFDLVAAAVGAG